MAAALWGAYPWMSVHQLRDVLLSKAAVQGIQFTRNPASHGSIADLIEGLKQAATSASGGGATNQQPAPADLSRQTPDRLAVLNPCRVKQADGQGC